MKKILLGSIAGLLLIWAALFLVYLPSQLVKAQNIPFTATPEAAGLDFDNVSIPVPGEKLSLSAWWMPAENPRAVILFVHGANANKEDFYFGAIDYYAEMVERGYDVLAIDLRNHGGSGRTESGELRYGKEEYKDVVAALGMVETLAPGLPIIGSGVSMGGATLIEAAARDNRFSALVLIDPLLDPPSATLAGMEAITGLPASLLKPTVWSTTTFFGLGGEGSGALETAKSLTLPILLIQDPGDPVTQARFSAEVSAANDNIVYHLVPDAPANHPAIIESGGWGSHGAAYRVHKAEVLDKIDRFLGAL